MFGRMWLHGHASISRLSSYLAAAALGAITGCSFQPGELTGGPGGGDRPDATEASPDARVADAGRMSDAAAPLDASRDAGDPIDVTTGLVAYWPLDAIEGSSPQTTPDTIGTLDGEIEGPATIVSENINGALSLDGQSAFVRIANAPELGFTGRITIAAWCRATATDGVRNIVAHGSSNSPNAEVYLRIIDGEYQGGRWDGVSDEAKAPVQLGDVGNWVHLATVFDGTTWRLYRNGVEEGTGGDEGALMVNAEWAIGARARVPDRHFEGEIDEVRIYNRPLLAAEILALATMQPLRR
jgi:hypothetical protein